MTKIRQYILEAYQANPERYFDIGHDNPKAYNWAWINNNLEYKKGGTHGSNFGHERANSFKGWYDPDDNIITVVVPETVTKGNKPKMTDIPTRILRSLDSKFSKDAEMELF